MKQRQKTPDMPLAMPIQEQSPATAADDQPTGLLTVPMSRLKIHPFNSRAVRTQERIEEVCDMLKASTQREPITIVPGRTAEDIGYYYILSGQTRFHAANLAGWTEMTAQINNTIDPADNLAFFAASIEHNASEKETDYDLSVRVRELINAGTDTKEIQKAIRQTDRGLRRLLSISDLPETVNQIIKDYPTKLTAPFWEILRSATGKIDEDTLTKITKSAAEEGLSQRALQTLVDEKLRRRERLSGNTPRAKRQYTRPILNGENQQAGEIKIMNSRKNGHLLISLSAELPEEEARRLQERIEVALLEARSG